MKNRGQFNGLHDLHRPRVDHGYDAQTGREVRDVGGVAGGSKNDVSRGGGDGNLADEFICLCGEFPQLLGADEGDIKELPLIVNADMVGSAENGFSRLASGLYIPYHKVRLDVMT